MSDVLDLDRIAPKPKKVLLGGETIEAYPPMVGNIFELQSLFVRVKNGEAVTKQEFEDCLKPMIPAMKDKKLDISVEQLGVLIEFLYGQAVKKGVQKPTLS